MNADNTKLGLRRVWPVLGSLVFLVVAPGTVAGLVPYWITGWRFQTRSLPIQVIGAVLIVLAALVLVDAFARFALQGLGTPAPVNPTRHLVISGLYRIVRNPMYVAVVAVILGQAMLFGNVELLAYGALVWLGFHLFVIGYEEPTLRRSYGQEYEDFCAAVPRWLPGKLAHAGRAAGATKSAADKRR